MTSCSAHFSETGNPLLILMNQWANFSNFIFVLLCRSANALVKLKTTTTLSNVIQRGWHSTISSAGLKTSGPLSDPNGLVLNFFFLFSDPGGTLEKLNNLKPLFNRNEELYISKEVKEKMLWYQRANHADHKHYRRKSICVTTSQFEISRKNHISSVKTFSSRA